MKYYITILILCSVYIPLLGQDTVMININSHDTSYYKSFLNVGGHAYRFQDNSDSVFIELGQKMGGIDMGHVSAYPTYKFKSIIPNGLYYLYIDSLLHEVVRFKNSKKTGRHITYQYDFRDNEIGWDYERSIMEFTPKDCRRKRNTFNLVVFAETHQYKNGVEVSNTKLVYSKKRRLCRLTFTEDVYRSVNYLIHRELRKKYSRQKKIKQILF